MPIGSVRAWSRNSLGSVDTKQLASSLDYSSKKVDFHGWSDGWKMDVRGRGSDMLEGSNGLGKTRHKPLLEDVATLRP